MMPEPLLEALRSLARAGRYPDPSKIPAPKPEPAQPWWVR